MTELYGFDHARNSVADYQRQRDHQDAMRRFHEQGDSQLKTSRAWLENYKQTVPRQTSFNWQGRLGALSTIREINDAEEAKSAAGSQAGNQQEEIRQGLGDAAGEASGAGADGLCHGGSGGKGRGGGEKGRGGGVGKRLGAGGEAEVDGRGDRPEGAATAGARGPSFTDPPF